MKIFEKIGRVLGDVASEACFGLSLFTMLVLMLIGLAFGPIVMGLAMATPFAGIALFCILSFFKELSMSVRKHFFEK